MLRKYRYIAFGLLIVIVNLGVTLSVAARVSGTLLPAGVTRYAMVSRETTLTNTNPENWLPTQLSTSVTIPTGKKADVTVQFCGEAYPGTFGILYLRAKIGGALLRPGDVTGLPLKTVADGYGTDCISFYRTGVPAGTKSVKVEWQANDATAYLRSRSMIVTLNIH